VLNLIVMYLNLFQIERHFHSINAAVKTNSTFSPLINRHSGILRADVVGRDENGATKDGRDAANGQQMGNG
jgi:hypothetical protein